MTGNPLGPLVRTHETDIRARRTRVLSAVGAGLLLTTAAVALTGWLFIAQDIRFLAMFVLVPLLGGPGTVCLSTGISKLGRALGTGREYVELHERGIVLHVDEESTTIKWRDIHRVGKRGHRANSLERMAGVDLQWKIWITDGRTTWFDGNTEDAEELADVITAAWQREQDKRSP
ncbi:hypothetical protein [Amycolatopsis nigrescens]|uniref:hypothetical protein n=1 Tax=Amycolatopsis nigrescens TaxID=381445 RepID=UPI00039DA3A0|nr:hypothetical protein [Amycolatopsis nigrescens]